MEPELGCSFASVEYFGQLLNGCLFHKQSPKFHVVLNRPFCSVIGILLTHLVWVALRRYSVSVAVRRSLYTEMIIYPNRSLGNRKPLRFNCRIVQCTGITPAPYLVLPTRPAPWSGNVFPSLRRGAVQSCIVIVSL